MEKTRYTTAVILAAGIGSRFSADFPKQRALLCGKSLIRRAAESFGACDDVDSIVVVTRSEDVDFVNSELRFLDKKLYAVVIGGKCRAESAKLGFAAIPRETTHVAIHDGARCIISPNDVSRVIRESHVSGAASAVAVVTDTVKRYNGKHICGTIPRDEVALAQTPQAFSVDIYKAALSETEDVFSVTDDNMLVEKLGISISAVLLKEPNPKITYESDLEYAEFLLTRREK